MNNDDIIEKYGKVLVRFNSYYKFTFSFVGDSKDGCRVSINVGGDSDDIYSMYVSRDEFVTVRSLEPYNIIVTKNGNTLYNVSDIEWYS